MTRHIIPDIHGQIDKLEAALTALCFKRKNGAWRHPLGDTVVFLGDFVDRGPGQAQVIRTVREMIDAGVAQAVMGNHELNAIHYHMDDPETGDGLRIRDAQNTEQHAAFLAEFPLGSPEAKEAIAWMKTLPLYLDTGDIRAVHACWDPASIDTLTQEASGGRLDDEQLIRAVRAGDPLRTATEILAKGPEIALPDGQVVHDQSGIARSKLRFKWWVSEGRSWREASISVDRPEELPEGNIPDDTLGMLYGPEEKPVFFGHYWLKGAPVLEAPNALCLDYSAGIEGPMVTYRHEHIGAPIRRENIIVHALP